MYGQNPPDFTLSIGLISSGSNGETYQVIVSSVNNFNSPVTLTLTNLPPNTTYLCGPNPVNGGSGSSSCAVTTTSIGTFKFNINGSGGGINHSITATLTHL